MGAEEVVAGQDSEQVVIESEEDDDDGGPTQLTSPDLGREESGACKRQRTMSARFAESKLQEWEFGARQLNVGLCKAERAKIPGLGSKASTKVKAKYDKVAGPLWKVSPSTHARYSHSSPPPSALRLANHSSDMPLRDRRNSSSSSGGQMMR